MTNRTFKVHLNIESIYKWSSNDVIVTFWNWTPREACLSLSLGLTILSPFRPGFDLGDPPHPKQRSLFPASWLSVTQSIRSNNPHPKPPPGTIA